jgi:SAM-dependent methyltransferase
MQKRHLDRDRYFWEQSITSEKYFIPYIEKFKQVSSSTEILEVGCGDGGNLVPFVKRDCKVTAIDRAGSRIEMARKFYFEQGYHNVRLLEMDIFHVDDIGEFDIILLNDVIEHIPNHTKTKMLEILKKLLKRDGIIFLGFPAWQMPFGGHQQICKNSFLSWIPFIHLLPLQLYKFILKVFNEKEAIIKELLSIRESRISIENYYRLLKESHFFILGERFYLINPHYEIKFNLHPVLLPDWLSRIPYFRNFFITACFSIITKE